ncbi:MAG: putative glycosyl hydrolase [Bacteroidetes bacterium]|nr:MAG: putative glycosyl hydrolase [Bacteroidota bacterium]
MCRFKELSAALFFLLAFAAFSRTFAQGGADSAKQPKKKGLVKNIYGQWLNSVGVSDTLKNPFVVVFDSIKNRAILEVLPQFMRGPGPGIHEREEKRYLAALRQSKNKEHYLSEQQWVDVQAISPGARYRGIYKLKPGKTVYGFHPFWNGNSYYAYDFNLLSRIGYFSYPVDPATGRSRAPFMAHSWRNTPLHQRAHDKACKVDLVVTCYGAQATSRLLAKDNVKAQQTLLDSLVYLLSLKHSDGMGDSIYRGDGITLDFQGFRAGVNAKKELTRFVFHLRKALDASGRREHLNINLVLPLWDPTKSYEIDSLRNYVDLFIITGYDYNMDNKSASGPVTMLFPDTNLTLFSIDHSVNYYLDQGMPREKTVLCLPWFGKEVKTVDEKIGADTRLTVGEDPVQIRPYALLQQVYGSWDNFKADKTKNAIYCAVRDKSGWKQIWADDTTTLGMKYDYVRKKMLAGAGIWALGYENGRPELWRLLQQKFSDTAVADTPGPKNIDSTIAHNELVIEKQKQVFTAATRDISLQSAGVSYPVPLPFEIPKKNFGAIAVFTLLALLGFAIVGFIISMFYESVREVVLSKDYFIYIVMLVACLCVMLLLQFFTPGNKTSAVFITGAVAGSIVVALLFRMFRKKRPDGPTP